MSINLPDVSVHHREQGKGPPIVLLHSLATDGSMWDGVAPRLARAGYRVLRPDLRGHGRSGRPPGPYRLEDFAADLEGWIDALGLGRPHLVGLSLGGMVAQAFALRRPRGVRSLVLANTTALYPAAGRAILEERAALAEVEGMAPVAKATVARWFTPAFAAKRPTVVQAYREGTEACDPAAYAAAARAVAGVAYLGRLPLLKVPTLVIAGRDDAAIPPAAAEEITRAVPGAQLALIDAAHLSAIEAPEAFADTVLRFVRSVDGLTAVLTK